ncbi:MAG TPA: glycosyltransferase family 39 protein [Patescibacteria group bacterium]|nr:glycosyltransferase family 39 protein [Patescibacteria group bacterium]
MVSNKTVARILLVFLVLGFVVRLYRLNNPIADWHAWRQADTSAVSRNFVTEGFDLLHPKFDDLSNVPSGLDNPNGYRFVEFPIYNVAQAGLFKLFGILTLEEWGRLVSILASLAGSYFLFKLTSKYSGRIAGLGAAFFYLFLPFDIYYSRTILPDTSMVATLLAAIYFFDLWLDDKKKRWLPLLLATIFLAVSVLLKPYGLFYGLVFLAMIYQRFGWGFIKQLKLYLFALCALAPFVAWRMWISKYPEGIPASAWLFNGNGIRFRPAFFRWMGYERLTKLISGYTLVILQALGLYQLRFEKATIVYGAFVLSAVAYVCVIATGNVQHDYYQIVIMPVVAMIFGLGTKFLLEMKPLQKLHLGKILLVLLTVTGLYLSWLQVRDYFNINNWSIVIAGQVVDQVTPKDAKVIALYDGDTSFLYQTKRKGWASFEKPLPQMIKMGADYLVLANPTKVDEGLGKDYKIIKETKEYMLINLHQKP